MNEQLDVFLGAETQPFLLRLFDVINSGDYLKTPLPAINANAAPIEEIMPSSQDTQSTSTVNESDSTVSNVDSQQSLNKSTSDIQSRQTKSPRLLNDQTTDIESDFVNSSPLGSSISKLRDVSPISPVKSGNDIEHHRQQRRRSARSRSRSRSPTRARRNEREKYSSSRSHLYRNKSPTNDSDRRKTANPFRRNSGHEARSPKYYKCSDSPIDNANGERLLARSLSPVPKNNRCRDFDEKG